MIIWLLGKKLHQTSQTDFAWLGCDTSRPRQMVDIQYDIAIIGGREVSRPYRVWFFAEGEWFLSFWRCHRPRGEGGVGVVVWLIQASASNHKPKPSLWFAKIISLTAIICQPHLLTLQNNLD